MDSLSIGKAAEFLNLSQSIINTAVKNGELKCMRDDDTNTRFFKKSELRKYKRNRDEKTKQKAVDARAKAEAIARSKIEKAERIERAKLHKGAPARKAGSNTTASGKGVRKKAASTSATINMAEAANLLAAAASAINETMAPQPPAETLESRVRNSFTKQQRVPTVYYLQAVRTVQDALLLLVKEYLTEEDPNISAKTRAFLSGYSASLVDLKTNMLICMRAVGENCAHPDQFMDFMRSIQSFLDSYSEMNPRSQSRLEDTSGDMLALFESSTEIQKEINNLYAYLEGECEIIRKLQN